jgi:phage FluMu protein Com
MPNLTTKPGTTVFCPRCGKWLARIDAASAEVEVNCTRADCRVGVKIVKENGKISRETVERPR